MIIDKLDQRRKSSRKKRNNGEKNGIFVYRKRKKKNIERKSLKPGFKITRGEIFPLDSTRNAARNPSKISPTVRHEWANTKLAAH